MIRIASTLFVTFALGGCAGSVDESSGQSSDAIESVSSRANGTHLRILAGNLSSGNQQSWDPGHGMRILKGLAPDVALLQEFNFGSNTDADYKTFLATAFDASFSYTVESDHAQIPNGVVSRYPIKESGTWNDPQVSNREFQWARIDIPGDKDLWAVSVHLLTSGNRSAEASALVGHLKQVAADSDYIVIGGDFNSPSRTDGSLQTFSQIMKTKGPWPTDPSGKEGTNASRKKPYDWVLADPDLDALMVPVKIGSGSYASGLVFDSRTFPNLADVAPVQKGDSGSSNMQHMAVVKDFVLPE
jgi:endonuclease/exonuclease/phosphatase family metal-dependent hydrolase